MAKREVRYSRTETLSMMQENSAGALRKIAETARKNKWTREDIISFMEELADEMEAQIEVYKV